jgi:hypothetical protein
MPTYTITPQDVLMFRDGRPMEGGLSGHGARWPEPGIIFDALHAALHRAFPEIERAPDGMPRWEHEHRYGRSSNRDYNRTRSQRFGSLATIGPFPVEKGTWFFPCPTDMTVAANGTLATLHPLRTPGGSSNLPSPLRFPLANPAAPSKDEPKPWWSKAAIESYLSPTPKRGEEFWERELRDAADLYAGEWATGIAIDPATQTTGQGEAAGKIYSAEYLRLRDEVVLGIHATMRMQNGQPGKIQERLTELFPAHRTIIVGGQQRACQVEPLAGGLEEFLPLSAQIPKDATRIKWVLLSPAVFPEIEEDEVQCTDGQRRRMSGHGGGWLPNWVAPHDDFPVWQGENESRVEKGRVLLKQHLPRNSRSRDPWRKAVREAPFLDCRLVAARIPKPVVLTGWTGRVHLLRHERAVDGGDLKHGPRPTLLAVPAGAVYYFDGKDAPLLAEVLAWHGSECRNIQTIKNRRSTLLGEKGFGLGVCGTWSFYGE